MKRQLAMGVDVGTQGARIVVADASGSVVVQAVRPFAQVALPNLPPGHIEQDPRDWWSAVRECLASVLADLDRQGLRAEDIAAASVDSTSGTVVLLDETGEPLRPAVMYNDRRAQAEADEVNAAAGSFGGKVGYRFNSSFALPRLLWLARHEPALWERARHAAHAADYIVGRLTGYFGVSDQSNALKTGFDLVDFAWPGFVRNLLGVGAKKLPRIVWSGDGIGRVSALCAAETGLSTTTRVVAGMTDGCADQVSSGAREVGDWNTVLGTTLVLKGMTGGLLRDPLGRVYCHRHPSGRWMPGGASNVGARALDERFPGIDRAEYGRRALALSPTGLVVYPLAQAGERFPFVAPEAAGFVEGDAGDEFALYAGYLEGVAFTERLAYEVVEDLGAEVGQRIYATGGGAASPEWTQIRADVLNRELVLADHPGAAMGSAIVAASRTLFADLAEATGHMVTAERVVAPRPAKTARYAEDYARFVEALLRRGYLPKA